MYIKTFHNNLRPTPPRKIVLRVLSFVLTIFILLSSFTISVKAMDWSHINIPLNSDSVTIVEANHGIRLYEKQADITRSMPLVNHLMTAILALEYLDARTTITLSQEAALLSDDVTTFTAGRRYPLEYLLLALMLDDSNAAAFALAEEISGSEESFVSTMNNRAAGLGMTSTYFTNASGQYDPDQYTNTNDLMTLLRFALRDSSFLSYFGQRDNMYTMPDGTRHYFANDFSSAWSFSDNFVNGAMLAAYDDRYTAVLLQTDSVKNITYAVVMTGPYTESSFTNNRQLIADLQNISSRISAAYETSILARRGTVFQSNYEIAGQTVNLVYGETVSYTHPLGQSYQESVQMVLNQDEMHLPLSTSDVLGHVEFRLSEGSFIRVSLTSDTVIHAQNDTLNYILSIINANQELVFFILALLAVFFMILIIRFIRFLTHRIYLIWLRRKRRSFDSRDILVNDSEVDGQPSVDRLLFHKVRSKPGTIPEHIILRYRKIKNISEEDTAQTEDEEISTSEATIDTKFDPS